MVGKASVAVVGTAIAVAKAEISSRSYILEPVICATIILSNLTVSKQRKLSAGISCVLSR